MFTCRTGYSAYYVFMYLSHRRVQTLFVGMHDSVILEYQREMETAPSQKKKK